MIQHWCRIFKCVHHQGSFRGGTRGNAVPIVKAFRTPKNALYCRRLRIQYQTFFAGDTPRSPLCLDQDTNFRLAPKRLHCYCFTKRPLVQAYSMHGVATKNQYKV